jgi:hypothetical protein
MKNNAPPNRGTSNDIPEQNKKGEEVVINKAMTSLGLHLFKALQLPGGITGLQGASGGGGGTSQYSRIHQKKLSPEEENKKLERDIEIMKNEHRQALEYEKSRYEFVKLV